VLLISNHGPFNENDLGNDWTIVAGNSGIAGDPDSRYPAIGMIKQGSNLDFLLNCIDWVSRR
jgi:hypothetical protein